ncbi:alanine dehydrogenase [Micrococcus luteus]|jgi:alanine dehydrogenase|uniref:Alanine dehydrogenase n=1 Tax=Micrococcus luteus (strain ATCC 4698 / DSM 20030 / JCM 1464 / CCM 169 / CCUG 5858 / IAM 1056 / NBRC 3333 / NCIMB 9278 / NCTC 2665 / VKM Ac-2230) TaxID=465515 RepID=C5C6X7_MICLC|nr:alanine dehydrogenase [Micrococcus luteus]ACS31465.1 L-alanine dehydrogenase [Micrococcus luteus NCTC 2665]AJO56520.1 alanine dehydrogenase [Micrococcus luteus]KAB1899106.1 alanine dehydrogenase [Micrococcus luteus NCTC 2665]MCV7527191.1 alanine dehydrogenase [Micrococcus luteus]ORE63046.1 alanine dehydrogenase [Micrococcus luteus]
MLIGVPTEVKNNEFRVALTQGGVQELVRAGHDVLVQAGAGLGSGTTDQDYLDAGAELVEGADEVWERAELILKVKEPQAEEYPRMRRGQVLFTYLHLAASPECTRAILDSGTTAIAYETVTQGRTLPLLAPMSQVAGRLAPAAGAYHLTQAHGGSGVLMGGVPGTRRARVAVIGGGVAGEAAGVIAAGMGADVTVLDISLERLAQLDAVHQGRLRTLASSHLNIAETVADADLVIGSVLIPGAAAPKLVTAEMVEAMRPGSVLVDIAIDQGGCFENSRPTAHQDPTYLVGDKIYYCVSNMPGAVPQTSTAALTNATLPYIKRIADQGWRAALSADEGFAGGLNAHDGVLTLPSVFEAVSGELGLDPEKDVRATSQVLAGA